VVSAVPERISHDQKCHIFMKCSLVNLLRFGLHHVPVRQSHWHPVEALL
jgi:hypothetical protein